MKRIAAFLVALLLLCGTAYADDGSYAYSSALSESGMSGLSELLPEETAEQLAAIGIDIADYESILSCDINGVINAFYSISAESLKAPLTVLALGFALLVLCGMLGGMFHNSGTGIAEGYRCVCIVSLAAVVLAPVINTVSACVGAVQGSSKFMLGFIPAFAAVLAYSGAAATAAVYQGTMLGVCQLVMQAFSLVISPLCSAYLSLGVAACASGVGGAEQLSLKVKSIVTTVSGFVMTLFTGFLGIQSAVAKSADTLALKTARFFVSGGVPVVGGALGEAITTVTASLSLLRSAAFSWCVAALALMVLPVVIKLFAWRFVLYLLSAAAGMLSLPEPARLFDIISAAVGMLVAVTLTVTVMLVLSLAAVRQVV